MPRPHLGDRLGKRLLHRSLEQAAHGLPRDRLHLAHEQATLLCSLPVRLVHERIAAAQAKPRVRHAGTQTPRHKVAARAERLQQRSGDRVRVDRAGVRVRRIKQVVVEVADLVRHPDLVVHVLYAAVLVHADRLCDRRVRTPAHRHRAVLALARAGHSALWRDDRELPAVASLVKVAHEARSHVEVLRLEQLAERLTATERLDGIGLGNRLHARSGLLTAGHDLAQLGNVVGVLLLLLRERIDACGKLRIRLALCLDWRPWHARLCAINGGALCPKFSGRVAVLDSLADLLVKPRKVRFPVGKVSAVLGKLVSLGAFPLGHPGAELGSLLANLLLRILRRRSLGLLEPALGDRHRSLDVCDLLAECPINSIVPRGASLRAEDVANSERHRDVLEPVLLRRQHGQHRGRLHVGDAVPLGHLVDDAPAADVPQLRALALLRIHLVVQRKQVVDHELDDLLKLLCLRQRLVDVDRDAKFLGDAQVAVNHAIRLHHRLEVGNEHVLERRQFHALCRRHARGQSLLEHCLAGPRSTVVD